MLVTLPFIATLSSFAQPENTEAASSLMFSGTVTFTNARKVADAAAAMPHDRVLIETDCPYLAPHPHRGTLNHSGNLEYTNRAVAMIKGISEEECAAETEENARRFFGI